MPEHPNRRTLGALRDASDPAAFKPHGPSVPVEERRPSSAPVTDQSTPLSPALSQGEREGVGDTEQE